MKKRVKKNILLRLKKTELAILKQLTNSWTKLSFVAVKTLYHFQNLLINVIWFTKLLVWQRNCSIVYSEKKTMSVLLMPLLTDPSIILSIVRAPQHPKNPIIVSKHPTAMMISTPVRIK